MTICSPNEKFLYFHTVNREKTARNTPGCPPGQKSPWNAPLSVGITTTGEIALYCPSGRGTSGTMGYRGARGQGEYI